MYLLKPKEKNIHPVRIIDPVTESLKHLLVICFSKSSSRSYPMAIKIAQTASAYFEQDEGNEIIHIAIFKKTADEARKAQSFLIIAGAWKGFIAYVNGRPQTNYWDIAQVLSCFITASDCKDYRAHCYQVIDLNLLVVHPYRRGWDGSFRKDQGGNEKLVVFPCTHLLNNFLLLYPHPSKAEDQLQASAVKHNSDFCPYFNPHNFIPYETYISKNQNDGKTNGEQKLLDLTDEK